jgi:hypothetical protein
MISQAGIAVFVFGNKEGSNGIIVNSDGMMNEFEIAKKQNKIIIPVGSTGGAALEIYNSIKSNISDFPYLQALSST